jgi:hypothetical protein
MQEDPTTQEEWRDIPWARGVYQASSLGRIRSLDRIGKIGQKLRGRILKQHTNHHGYQMVVIGNTGNPVRVHHMVLDAFVGPRPDGTECRHLNGDPSDNRPCNLSWGTQLQNFFDSVKHGTSTSKLSPQDVLEIRELRESGKTHEEIAAIFEISSTQVGRIVNGESWIWVS